MFKLINRIAENVENIVRFLKFIGFLVILTMIFRLSPRIATFIYNIEVDQMTIIVEWVLIAVFSIMLLINPKGGKNEKNSKNNSKN